MNICTIIECGRKRYSQEYCRMHFERLKRTGNLGPSQNIKGKGANKTCVSCGKNNKETVFAKKLNRCLDCHRLSERKRAEIYYDKHLKEKREYSKKYRESIEMRFENAKWQATVRRNLSWALNLGEFSNFIDQPCVYCKNKLGDKVCSGSGLDRIDNDKGYEINNVQSCCAICNRLRSNLFTVEETHAMVDAILKLRE